MTNINKKRLFMTTLLSGAVMGFAAAPTIAQDASDDEIVVTGSRIKKADFTANAPVATVEGVQFERTGAINTENLLNTLPQTVPGLDRTSNNPGNGSATVNLRGLGENRTLVLVNGARQVPFGLGGVVDLNTIPLALIENVEVLTGGASSVYGSDAVAGVVNFILNENFEGMEATLGAQMTQEGDAGLYNASLTLGTSLDNGRGNVAMAVTYTNREALFQGDRDFATFAQFDDGAGGLFNGGSSLIPELRVNATLDFPGGGSGVGVFNPDGTIRQGNFDFFAAENDFYNYAPVNYIQLPQERATITTLGRYEINEKVEAYARASFSSNKVDSQLAPTPILQNSTFSIDGNPFISPSAQAILSAGVGDGVDTDGDGIDDTGTAQLRRRLEEVGPRRTVDDNQQWQITAGLRGETGIGNWDYDVYLQEGRTLRAQAQEGNVNRSRFDQALLLADDPANPGNVLLDAAGNPSCADPAANGATAGCSPVNLFGQGNISAEGAAFLNTAVASRTTYEQTVLAANFSGDLGDFTITGDAIGAAFGVEYIENEGRFDPSQDLAASTIAGFNGSPASSGGFDVYSVYGELAVPVLADLPFAQSVTLDLAGRLSEYSSAGSASTYKIGGDWTVNDQVRFRGNYNTAVRAPSIAELFSPQGINFPGASDPCSAQGIPAGGTTVPAAIAAICTATGVPTASLGSPLINTISGQVQSLSGGNPDLEVETAETFTIGAVFTPSFVPGLTFSLDYYDITIEDAIAEFGGGANNVLSTCYGTDTTAGLGAGSAFCNVITRRADGSIDVISLTSQNVAEITTSGVDLSAQYSFDTADLFGTDFGTVSINYLGSVIEENNFVAFDGADVIECAGKFGADCGEPDPTYRHRMTSILSRDNLSVQGVWRFVGEVEDDGGIGVVNGETIDATSYFDASTTWDASDNLALTFGINNLLNTEPQVLGDNQEQANTYPATYDVFGRTFFANAKVKF